MAKRATTEDHLAQLRALRGGEASETAREALRHIIEAPKVHGLVLKMAAELAEKWEARALALALQHAATGMAGTEDAVKRDRGCEGKQAVLHALVSWEADVPEFFLAASEW